MKTTQLLLTAAIALSLSACSTAPDKVHAAYVPASVYQDYTCDELASQAREINTKSIQAHHTLDQAHKNDGVAVAVGALVFWPALLFLATSNEDPTAYASLKGNAIAVQESQIAKKCQFTPVKIKAVTVPKHIQAKQDRRTRTERQKDERDAWQAEHGGSGATRSTYRSYTDVKGD